MESDTDHSDLSDLDWKPFLEPIDKPTVSTVLVTDKEQNIKVTLVADQDKEATDAIVISAA